MSEPLFRIGGHYRNQLGYITRIDRALGAGLVQASELNDRLWVPYRQPHRLSDGRSAWAFDSANCSCHLIPGELHQVDGEWVPVEEKKEPRPSICEHECAEEVLGGDKCGKTCAATEIGPMDAAMIARDSAGVARTCPTPPAAVAAPVASTALPANPALQRMSDTGSHQFGSMKR